MTKQLIFAPLIALVCFTSAAAQVPLNTHIQILKAEDARRYDKTLEDLMKSPNAAIRERAALAAGRIGDERAVDSLARLFMDNSPRVREMAAFALGEIEAMSAGDRLLPVFGEAKYPKLEGPFAGRMIEAAGKIAAANPSDERSKALGAAILSTLSKEFSKPSLPAAKVVPLGLTAVLRARPAGGEVVVRRFLTYTDPAIVADALNTLARLRAKNANTDARALLQTHTIPVVRANAARVLGAADDKEAVDVLIKAATSDADSRVRVSAIRALGTIRVAKSADPLLARGEVLLAAYKKNLKPNFIPVEQNEFLEISTALGQVLAKTGNARAVALFRDFAKVDNFRTAEPYIARVKVGGIRPGAGLGDDMPPPTTYRQYSTLVQTIGELASYEPESPEAKKIKDEAPEQLRKLVKAFIAADPKAEREAVMAAPDALRAFARFKTDDLGEITRTALRNKDVQIRATAAGILADQPYSEENLLALAAAFGYAREFDVQSNDAMLATLDALLKVMPQDERGSVTPFILATESPDQLVRAKGFNILTGEPYKTRPMLREIHKAASEGKFKEVSSYSGKGTKLGQILNTDADYRRALSSKNGRVSAVFTTSKGNFTIDLLAEDAPLTVDNFIKLARSGYFNGLEVHRVVPNFVMQDGDPRGDGNGGPGWTIRCEINSIQYERGAVGMALSGKDTGGSQWFVTHSPQPHLDGGYTVFGRVNETGMKVVDNIVRGDKILAVRIIGK